MHLCIDQGNTRCKYAVFQDREMLEHTITKSLSIRKVKQLLKKYTISKGMVSSTRNVDLAQWRKISAVMDIEELNAETKIPIINLYETPETLGKDRLAGVIAGNARFPSDVVVVIDAGTCITFDVITPDKQYHGGNISPGIKMRLEAMHRFTDKLPWAQEQLNMDVIGKSTVKALQNGAVYGTIGEVDSFIRRISEKFGATKVVLTGGDADKFVDTLESVIFVLPYLILEGLNEILHYQKA